VVFQLILSENAQESLLNHQRAASFLPVIIVGRLGRFSREETAETLPSTARFQHCCFLAR
jgi:hypothetical protein